MTPPWTTQWASDVVRDGLGLELLDKAEDIVAEVFRCDADKTVTVRMFRADVPEPVVRELVRLARKGLGCFEDGTPLPVRFRREKLY